jgi:hypothetical protein
VDAAEERKRRWGEWQWEQRRGMTAQYARIPANFIALMALSHGEFQTPKLWSNWWSAVPVQDLQASPPPRRTMAVLLAIRCELGKSGRSAIDRGRKRNRKASPKSWDPSSRVVWTARWSWYREGRLHRQGGCTNGHPIRHFGHFEAWDVHSTITF